MEKPILKDIMVLSFASNSEYPVSETVINKMKRELIQ